MREFKDDMGRSWVIAITCTATKKIAAHAGFDFADLSNGKAMELFGGNFTHLLDVLWPLVESEAAARGISHDSFGDGLRGESIDAAVSALRDELLAFFPLQRRALLQKVIDKMSAMESQAIAQADAELANFRLNTESGGSLPINAPAS